MSHVRVATKMSIKGSLGRIVKVATPAIPSTKYPQAKALTTA